MRVAVLGGTGSFGHALAVRLLAGGVHDVVIGSRDAARAAEAAAALDGTVGRTNEDAVRDADLVILAVKADGALETASAVAVPLGATPLLSVASAIEFRPGVGALPDPDALSLAERIQDVVAAPVVAGLHSIAAASLGAARPDEDALSVATTRTRSSSCWHWPASSLRGGHSMPVLFGARVRSKA